MSSTNQKVMHFYWIYIFSLLELIAIQCHITGVWTRCSAIAERPRCSVRYSFRQK